MDEVKCSICQGQMVHVFSAILLGKYNADYRVCQSCGYLKVHEPYWLNEAYSSAIADADTGLVARNVLISEKLSSLLFWGMAERGRGRYLDSAGGYGMLTRLMRDYGFDFYWSDKYCKNFLARGFEYEAGAGRCLAVTAMEVLEHVTDPVGYVEETLRYASADTLIFSTELYDGAPPNPDEWWYYSLPTGQHIGFFQLRTLQVLADKLGLNFYSANGIHIFTRRNLRKKWLRIVTSSYFAKATAPLLRRLMKSKTMDDHCKILSSVSRP
ncbi:class I SAM-dependent methyltransferase [Ectopseudomonas toyotomiensis]|uniref:class I SAM-dependent methyltransferase n=1 Tax=Ectopseudomonas toyotomiensis TaxID=554344 RepID=UPI003D0ED55E